MKKSHFTTLQFWICWGILVFLFAKTASGFATFLLIIYPAWDVVGTLLDIRANRSGASKTPQYVNAVISVITTIAVGITLQRGIPETLIVFGLWAILAGLIQLILGLRRRN